MHPINKKNFGAKAGKLAVKFHDGSSIRTGWVLAQVATTRYKVTDGTTTKICRLAQTASELTALSAGTGADAALRPTLCTIEITPHGGSLENVKRLWMARAQTVQNKNLTWKLGVASAAAGQGTIALIANATPTVANAIPDQVATVAGAFSYTVPANTFRDLNGDTLTYSATLGNDAALPAWLVFAPATRRFTKAAGAGSAGTVAVKVTVTDGTASISDTFDLVVS